MFNVQISRESVESFNNPLPAVTLKSVVFIGGPFFKIYLAKWDICLSPSFRNNTSDPKSLCFIPNGLQLNWKRADKASSHPGYGLQQDHTDEGLVIDMQQWHPLIILS